MPDHDEVPLLGQSVGEALDAGLRKAGVLCSLCGRTAARPEEPEPPKPGDLKPGEGAWHEAVLTGPPTMAEYVIITPSIGKGVGKPTVNVARFFHCQREDCDVSSLRAKANAVRYVPAFELITSDDEEEPHAH